MTHDVQSESTDDRETARIREVFTTRDRAGRAAWKDAASRLESAPGIKDPAKVRAYVEAARS